LAVDTLSGRLANKVALITGAGRGIGAATAELFAAEGARVVIAEIDESAGSKMAQVLSERGHDSLAVATDVSQPESVSAAFESAQEAFGSVDVLVNNAGIAVFDDPLGLSDADWRRCLSVDLDGVWTCCRAALPGMLRSGGGSIVNVASVHSFQVIPHTFPYPVAKHGVIGLTRALAVEYGGQGVRVNAVCPAYIATQVAVDYWNTFEDPEAERSRAASIHALGRVGEPAEVAAAILFLASHEASFITGASLMVDGGASIIFHH
jgi:NAD(P)-dependent dehydrogenase (short-subunit alcohol dehydrogenase family)